MLRKGLLIFIMAAVSTAAFSQDGNKELVRVKDIIPDAVIDLKYSDTNNFTHTKLYSANESYLLLEAAIKLKLVQDSLRKIRTHYGVERPKGLGVKIWDGYRPRSVQYLMWSILPNPTYVANPESGSVHNRGGAIDLTLIDFATGEELLMPTEFDSFEDKAAHDYPYLPAEAVYNRGFLKSIMVNVGGFDFYQNEWWHYQIPNAKNYELLDFQIR